MEKIETERVYLTKFKLSDAKRVAKICNDENLTRYLPLPYPYTLEMAKEWISSQKTDLKHLDYAVISKETNQLIGSISLSDKGDGCKELGYWLAPECHGKGIMTETAQCLISYAFEKLGVHKIIAKHYIENPASGKVMQKCGMNVVGILKKHALKNNIWHDVCLYEIINPHD